MLVDDRPMNEVAMSTPVVPDNAKYEVKLQVKDCSVHFRESLKRKEQSRESLAESL